MPGISDYFTQGGGFDDLGILGSAIMAGAYPGTNMGEILMQAQGEISRRRAGRRHEQRLAQQDARVARQDQWAEEDRMRDREFQQALGPLAQQLATQSGLAAWITPMLQSPNPQMQQQGIAAAIEQLGQGPEKPMVVNGRVIDPRDPSRVLAEYPDPGEMTFEQRMQLARAGRNPAQPRQRIFEVNGRLVDENGQVIYEAPPDQAAANVPSGYQPRPSVPGGLFGGGAPAVPPGLMPQPGGPADPAQAARLAQARQSVQQAKPTANERERDDLIKRFGLSDEEATDLANGYMTVTQPDQLGRVFIVNKRLGTSRLAAPKSDEPAGPVASAPERQQPPLAGDVPQATGAVSNLAAIADATIGQLFGGTMFPQTADARERVRLFERSAQEALVNNPKFPVAEQEFIRKMIPTAGDWFANPPTALRNLATFQAYLFDRRNAIDQTLRGGAVSRDEQIRLTDQKASIERVLGMIGTRQSGGGDNMEDPLGIR